MSVRRYFGKGEHPCRTQKEPSATTRNRRKKKPAVSRLPVASFHSKADRSIYGTGSANVTELSEQM
jgi:hypothetical protein